MKFAGLQTTKKPWLVPETETPDGRNELLSANGRLKTRLGIMKAVVINVDSGIYDLSFLKSGFCNESYRIITTGDGRIITNPENLIDIPQKEYIVAYWKMEDARVITDIPQKDYIIAYWKMEDAS